MINAADIFRGKILVVDDQEANIQMLEQMLRGAGYDAVSSTSDADSNGFHIPGVATITRSPSGSRSIAPQALHHRPAHPAARRVGRPRVLNAFRICSAPSSHGPASPSSALVSTLTVSSCAGTTAVRVM